MTHRLDPFYLIVDNAHWLERLVPLGVRLAQLRCKDMADETVRSEISRARLVCARHDCQLVINDFWQAAIELECDYVHLGQADMDTADFKAIRRAGLRLGLSTHDHAELERSLSYDPDYLALGPVYQTILKNMPWAPQGLDKLTEWKKLAGNRPLVAIGGLNPDRLAGVFAAGADSAAVVTDITLNSEPEARTLEWLAATRDHA